LLKTLAGKRPIELEEDDEQQGKKKKTEGTGCVILKEKYYIFGVMNRNYQTHYN